MEFRVASLRGGIHLSKAIKARGAEAVEILRDAFKNQIPVEGRVAAVNKGGFEVEIRYQPGFNVGLGFDGITVAMLGKTSPFGTIPAAILVGAMKAGSSEMQFASGVAKEITDVFLALILFFVAADVIMRSLLRMRKDVGEEVRLSSGWGKQ